MPFARRLLSLLGDVRRPSHLLAVAKDAGCCMDFAESEPPAEIRVGPILVPRVTVMCAKLADLYEAIERSFG